MGHGHWTRRLTAMRRARIVTYKAVLDSFPESPVFLAAPGNLRVNL